MQLPDKTLCSSRGTGCQNALTTLKSHLLWGSRLASLHLLQFPNTERERRGVELDVAPAADNGQCWVLGTSCRNLTQRPQCPAQKRGKNEQTLLWVPPTEWWDIPSFALPVVRVIFFKILRVTSRPSHAWCSSAQAVHLVVHKPEKIDLNCSNH